MCTADSMITYIMCNSESESNYSHMTIPFNAVELIKVLMPSHQIKKGIIKELLLITVEKC